MSHDQQLSYAGPDAPAKPQVIEHLPEYGRFRVVASGQEIAVLDYVPRNGVWNILHTYADPSVRGTGLASDLVRHVMDQARSAGLQIIPSCPYIPAWLRRHPEYSDLVARR